MTGSGDVRFPHCIRETRGNEGANYCIGRGGAHFASLQWPAGAAETARCTLADSSRTRLVAAASPRASLAWSLVSAPTMARQSRRTSTLQHR